MGKQMQYNQSGASTQMGEDQLPGFVGFGRQAATISFEADGKQITPLSICQGRYG